MLATIELLTPLGALVGLAGAAPLAAIVVARRRVAAARRALGLATQGVLRDVAAAICIAVAALLTALAATQPVVRGVERTAGRSDVAMLIAIDTSRSMLASGGPGAPTRLERARRVATTVRGALEDTPVGIVSIADRALPHLFPTLDPASFSRVLAGPIRGGHPPPAGGFGASSSLNALEKLGDGTIFPETAERRLVLVLTDAESDPLDARTLRTALRGRRPVELAIVRFGRAGEQVYDRGGLPEPGYRQPPGAESVARALARFVEGSYFDETAAVGARDWALDQVARSPRKARTDVLGVTRRELAPLLVGLAAIPLAALLALRGVPVPAVGGRFPGTLVAAWRRSSVG